MSVTLDINGNIRVVASDATLSSDIPDGDWMPVVRGTGRAHVAHPKRSRVGRAKARVASDAERKVMAAVGADPNVAQFRRAQQERIERIRALRKQYVVCPDPDRRVELWAEMSDLAARLPRNLRESI